jgi:hypothetical protein
MTVIQFPRARRDMARAWTAGNRVRSAGGSPMDAALEQVAVAFDLTAKHNGLKLRVETALRQGADSAGTRARYRNLATRAVTGGFTLNCSIAWLDGWTKAARALLKFQRGRAANIRLPLMVMAEARLALRWLRRHRPETFAGIVGKIAGTQTQAVE